MQILIYSEKTKQEYVVIPICANHVLYNNGFVSKYHIHPVYHLVFVLQGSGYLENDSTKHLLKEKDIFIVNPGEKHIYTSDCHEGMLHFTVNFYLVQMQKFRLLDNESFAMKSYDLKRNESFIAETTRLEDILEFRTEGIFIDFDQSIWGSVLTLHNAFTNRIENITQSPFYILSRENNINPMLFSNYYSRFVIEFFSLISGFDTNYSGSFYKKDDLLLNTIISYLNNNVASRYDLSCLAGRLNYSPEYLCSYFKKKTQMTISQYHNKLKINKACELLRRTDKTITEIASNFNYSSSNHFSNNFKKEKGISPKDYRRHSELP